MILDTLWRTLRPSSTSWRISSGRPTRSPLMQAEYDRRRGPDPGGTGRAGRVPGVRRAGRPPGGPARGPRQAAGGHGQDLPRAGDRETAGRFALELQRAREELAENRGPAPAARAGLREQPAEDQARRRQAGRDPQQDRQVRRRPQDERGRGRDGQAGPGVPRRRAPPTSASSNRASRRGSTSTGRRCAWPWTSPARAWRRSARKRPHGASLPRMRSASSSARWGHRRRTAVHRQSSRPARSRRRPGPGSTEGP